MMDEVATQKRDRVRPRNTVVGQHAITPRASAFFFRKDLYLRSYVVGTLLGVTHAHLRSRHRREARDALVGTDNFGFFGVTELHVGSLRRSD